MTSQQRIFFRVSVVAIVCLQAVCLVSNATAFSMVRKYDMNEYPSDQLRGRSPEHKECMRTAVRLPKVAHFRDTKYRASIRSLHGNLKWRELHSITDKRW